MNDDFDIEEIPTKEETSTFVTRELKAAIVILERIRFNVGPEFLRKDITNAIRLIESGLSHQEDTVA